LNIINDARVKHYERLSLSSTSRVWMRSVCVYMIRLGSKRFRMRFTLFKKLFNDASFQSIELLTVLLIAY